MSRTWRRTTLATVAALLILVVPQLSRLRVTPTAVEWDDIWIATVKKGSIPWQVRGSGTLVLSDHPANLIARVTVPGTFASGMRLNQNTEVDVQNLTTLGHVSYINPSPSNAVRGLEITLDSALPAAAGTNLHVDAIIELGQLHNILYVTRPVHAHQNSSIGVFKVVGDGGSAVRVNVKFSRASIYTIEILDGLKEGDQIIPSDMSAWDNFDQIRLR